MTTDSPQNEIWCKSCCQSYYQLHLGVRLLSVVLLSCQLMNFVLTSLSLRLFGCDQGWFVEYEGQFFFRLVKVPVPFCTFGYKSDMALKI